MYTGSIGSVSNRENWIQSVALIDTTTGDEFDVTGADISIFVTEQNCPSHPLISGSTEDYVQIADDGLSFTWNFPATTMGKLCAGEKGFYLRVALNGSGQTVQIISGNVTIVEGGPA